MQRANQQPPLHSTPSVPGRLRHMGTSGWIFRCTPLIYTLSWIITPWHHHAVIGWIAFLFFYATFLTGYFSTFGDSGSRQRIWLGVLFVLGYVAYPFMIDACGEFVFPAVMFVFFLREPIIGKAFRIFAAVTLLQSAGVVLETVLLHRPLIYAEAVIFYMVIFGLSNFTYSRHILASEQLERANQEIEHLAKIAERERIGRDLHDLLGHTLTVIVLKSDIANRLFSSQPEVAHREIAEVESTARNALAEVREAVSGYRADGLSSELSLARRALLSAGVQLISDVEHIVMPPLQTSILCFVVREAITNIIRHAGAAVCRIELHRQPELAVLTIEDDGNGDLAQEGNGLRGMRERVYAAAGSFQREHCDSSGTRLVVTLPIAPSALAAIPQASSASSLAISLAPPIEAVRG